MKLNRLDFNRRAKVHLESAPIYSIRNLDQTLITEGVYKNEKWVNWTVNDLKEIADLIKREFEIEWAPKEILERFPKRPYKLGGSKDTNRELTFLVFTRNRIMVRSATLGSIAKISPESQIFVRSDWGEAVLAALHVGVRKVIFQKKEPRYVGIDEAGKVIVPF